MATIKMQVYYLGSRKGIGKESGKPYNQVRVLEYNEQFASWGETALFAPTMPPACDKLKSGDLIEIELQQGSLRRSPQLVDIIRKVSDSPLKAG